jgi:glycosyltransferase involved in cell wall biosynthesis
MKKINSSISIVTACYNEEKNIKKTLTEWLNYFKKEIKFKNFEIVITDDGSIDGTAKILQKIKYNNKKIRLFTFKKNLGASIAFNNSIKESKYEFILIIDSDNQFPIKNFRRLWNEIYYKNNDAVIGARDRLKEITFLSFGSLISGKIMNIAYNSKIEDFNCALKIVKSNIIKKINLESVGLNYSTEMTAKILESNSKLSSIKVFHNKNIKKKKISLILKDSLNRILFVKYLIWRKLLLKLNIIKTNNGKN